MNLKRMSKSFWLYVSLIEKDADNPNLLSEEERNQIMDVLPDLFLSFLEEAVGILKENTIRLQINHSEVGSVLSTREDEEYHSYLDGLLVEDLSKQTLLYRYIERLTLFGYKHLSLSKYTLASYLDITNENMAEIIENLLIRPVDNRQYYLTYLKGPVEEIIAI